MLRRLLLQRLLKCSLCTACGSSTAPNPKKQKPTCIHFTEPYIFPCIPGHAIIKIPTEAVVIIRARRKKKKKKKKMVCRSFLHRLLGTDIEGHAVSYAIISPRNRATSWGNGARQKIPHATDLSPVKTPVPPISHPQGNAAFLRPS